MGRTVNVVPRRWLLVPVEPGVIAAIGSIGSTAPSGIGPDAESPSGATLVSKVARSVAELLERR